jgi:hypothetical protein
VSSRNSNKVIIARHLKCTSHFTSSFRHYKNIFGYICLTKTTCGRILHCRDHNAVLTNQFLRGRSRTKVALSRAVPAAPEPQPAQKVPQDRGPPSKRRSLRNPSRGYHFLKLLHAFCSQRQHPQPTESDPSHGCPLCCKSHVQFCHSVFW